MLKIKELWGGRWIYGANGIVLLINGIYEGSSPLILTFDPNFLSGTSKWWPLGTPPEIRPARQHLWRCRRSSLTTGAIRSSSGYMACARPLWVGPWGKVGGVLVNLYKKFWMGKVFFIGREGGNMIFLYKNA